MKIAMDDTPWFEGRLVDNFCRYTRVFTTSDRTSPSKPSSTNQWTLLNLLASELQTLGLADVQSDPQGYVYGRIPASPGHESRPALAFLAHVDTSPDAPGEGVTPLVHQNYSGGPLTLPSGAVLDPADHPLLARYAGQTIITSDGSTLLGADDKAGIAEIMTAAAFLTANPEFPHPDIEVVFTSDEEIGRGTENFPFSLIKSRQAYTLDGDEEGTYEAECYNAYGAQVTFQGISCHPGSARGKLVNAAAMAALFVTLLPRSESPEATDGRYGCVWANNIDGGIEKAAVDVFIRDFDDQQAQRRIASLDAYARTVEAAFPGGQAEVRVQTQYLNMKPKLDQRPEVVTHLVEAIRATGIEPKAKLIRGGTDGARLTELGLPTPNIFTGGMNYHSRTEWAALPAMVRASRVILELARLWAGSPA